MSRYTTFKHWLFDENKRPLYVDDNGNVLSADINTLKKPDGQLAILDNSPTGWDDVLIKYGRSNKYLGVIRDFTVPLTFVKNAAKIIKSLMWVKGFEAKMYYGLSKLDRYVFPPKYEAYYTGELDLSKLQQSRETVEVSVLDGGIIKYIKAYENTIYEIPVNTDPEAVTVYLDGLPFTNKVEWTAYEKQQFNGSTDYVIGLGVIVTEGTTQGIITQDQGYLAGQAAVPGGEYFFISDNKFTSAVITGSLKINFDVSKAASVYIRKRHIVNGVSLQTNYLISNTVGLTEVTINQTIPIVPGDHLYLTIRGDAANPGIDGTVEAGNLKLTYEVSFTPSLCKALKPKRLLDLLIAKITDGKHTAISNFLTNMDDLVYTSGTCIRGLPAQTIKISFNDFFKSLQRFQIMMGVENERMVIEKMERAFDATQIADLGTVANITVTPAEDMIYNTIKAGYANQTYDAVNGLDEFNVTQQWTTNILKITKELDLISPVRADMYGIELTRLELYRKDTTDANSDNDTFFLSVTKGATVEYYNGAYDVAAGKLKLPGVLYAIPNGTLITISGMGTYTVLNTSYLVVGFTTVTLSSSLTNGSYLGTINYTDNAIYRLLRPAYDSITGVLHPEKSFNTLLTPKQAILNNGNFIHSFIEDEGSKIAFQSGDKNSELSTALAGVTLTQKADVLVNTLPAKFYKPYYFEFETAIPYNFINTMKTTPYGTVKFNDENGKEFYGYLWDGGVKPATNDKQKWKLLCSPQTDLTNLI